MRADTTTRRRFLAGAGAATARAALAGDPPLGAGDQARARAGALYRPDLILQSGDAIYDALYADKPTTLAQWAAHRRIYDGIRTPVAHAVGNHDCWTGPGSEGDPLGGKALTLQQLGLETGITRAGSAPGS